MTVLNFNLRDILSYKLRQFYDFHVEVPNQCKYSIVGEALLSRKQTGMNSAKARFYLILHELVDG